MLLSSPKVSITLLLAWISVVSAHIEMKSPPPFRSKFNPNTENPDYSMTNPLSSDGSDYPAKGYATPEAIKSGTPVATLTAGSTVEVELAGSATHEGGSCQWGLSYDQGKTILVLHSAIGGCPLTLNYSVPIPNEVPSAEKALFFWTWQNKVGNREYQNAALVKVEGGSGPWTAPVMWRANTLEDGTCITKAGTSPNYPNPGPDPEYGGEYASSPPSEPTILDPCSLGKQDENATVNGSGGSDNSTSTAISSPSASQTDSTAATPIPTSEDNNNDKNDPKKCSQEGAITCNENAKTWSTCNNGDWVARGQIPEGVLCSNGVMMSRELAESIAQGIETLPAVASSSSVAPSPTPSETMAPEQVEQQQQATPEVAPVQNAQVPSAQGSRFVPAGVAPQQSRKRLARSRRAMNLSLADEPIAASSPEQPKQQDKTTCKGGADIQCGADGTTWSLCDADGQSWVKMGSVPAGVRCVKGSNSASKETTTKKNPSGAYLIKTRNLRRRQLGA